MTTHPHCALILNLEDELTELGDLADGELFWYRGKLHAMLHRDSSDPEKPYLVYLDLSNRSPGMALANMKRREYIDDNNFKGILVHRIAKVEPHYLTPPDEGEGETPLEREADLLIKAMVKVSIKAGWFTRRALQAATEDEVISDLVERFELSSGVGGLIKETKAWIKFLAALKGRRVIEELERHYDVTAGITPLMGRTKNEEGGR